MTEQSTDTADFYEAYETADAGRPFRPLNPPEGWLNRVDGPWAHWTLPQVELPEAGWKVHVSTALDNADHVLDVVAAACADLGVPFKHLSGRNHFLRVHGKHGSRVQSGKFCTLYPPTAEYAHEVLRRLEADLSGLAGPYVLTDRRFGDSQCVFYRHGAFRSRNRLEPDGTRTPTVLTSTGQEIEDERRPEFLLPPGVIDPFAPEEPTVGDGAVAFGGYSFEDVIRHSNGGGTYRARSGDGRQVFIKEARTHNGYDNVGVDAQTRMGREYLVMRALHARRPGLCPEPIEMFRHWEHTYLVMEHVAGVPLSSWVLTNNPLSTIGATPAAFDAYFRRCQGIVDQLEEQLAELHALGYVFGDVSPNNVMVDGDTIDGDTVDGDTVDGDTVRLIDFESTQPIATYRPNLGTPGFMPPEAMDAEGFTGADARHVDRYGVSAIARWLLMPTMDNAERRPESLDHVRAGLEQRGPVPPRLWREAVRFRAHPTERTLPTPDSVRLQPDEHLRWLQQRTADALEAAAELGHPHRIFPTTPTGLRTNTRCIAHGTAGVVHALRLAGRVVDPAVVDHLREESLEQRHETAPGLFFGSAGIAWVLADLGEAEAATELLDTAAEHPLLSRSAALDGGLAGVAMAAMALHGRTGQARYLDLAARLLDRVPAGDAVESMLGSPDVSGLVHGRPGIALALYYLARLTDDDAMLHRGLQLLRDELRHARDFPVGALGFRVSERDARTMPYLYAGSAGYAHVVARYLTVCEDEELRDVLRRCLLACAAEFTVHGGLFTGQSGLGLVLGDLARVTGRHDLRDQERGAALAMFRYAVPHATGVRWIGGDTSEKVSTDLWSGGAGVLLALTRALHDVPDPLFTLDEHVGAPITGPTWQPAPAAPAVGSESNASREGVPR